MPLNGVSGGFRGMLYLFCGFLSCRSLGCFGGSFRIVVAAYCAATFATGSGTFSVSFLGVDFLNLALFETFCHCRAYGVKDKLDRL